MKCLYLAPLRYPFAQTIAAGLSGHGFDVRSVDYVDFFSGRTNRVVGSLTSLPRKVRGIWEDPYERRVNERYLQIFKEFVPDLVFVYNNQLLLPEVIEQMGRNARVAFMLGDHPLYTPTSLHNLHILFYADYVICPDSMWRDQLKRLGIRNVVFDCFGYLDADDNPLQMQPSEMERYSSDLAYIGSSSKTNWGYKRLRFLDMFRNLDLRAYISGGTFEHWIDDFPELRTKIIPHDRFDRDFNRKVYACSKIAPVDLVPSLFNGVHVRVFDALQGGILPLCERSADLERIFSGIDIPLIDDYREGADVARHWLSDDQKRADCIGQMRDRVERDFAPASVIQRMVDTVLK